MKNKTTKNINESFNKLSEVDILASLLRLYEHQESIKITAKIKSINNDDEEYLYKDKKVEKIK